MRGRHVFDVTTQTGKRLTVGDADNKMDTHSIVKRNKKIKAGKLAGEEGSQHLWLPLLTSLSVNSICSQWIHALSDLQSMYRHAWQPPKSLEPRISSRAPILSTSLRISP